MCVMLFMEDNTIPEDWSESCLVDVYNGKEDASEMDASRVIEEYAEK